MCYIIRTIFSIECSNGKNIQNHSYYPTRDEILLLSKIKFKVKSVDKHHGGLSVIHLKETEKKSLIQSTLSVKP